MRPRSDETRHIGIFPASHIHRRGELQGAVLVAQEFAQGKRPPPGILDDRQGRENFKLGPPPSQAAGDKQSGEHPPTKRYRLTERIRHIIWELVVLSNESCRIENEKKCVVFLILCCEVPWN